MQAFAMRAAVCVFVMLASAGCPREYPPGTHALAPPCVDGTARFRLIAQVADAETYDPIEGVTVFLTNQLDPWSDPYAQSLGESDDTGHIDVEGWYYWGNCWEDLDPFAIDGSFRVTLAKAGYENGQFGIRVSEWPRRGNFATVDLGTVLLEGE
jgi:hypothetical protein